MADESNSDAPSSVAILKDGLAAITILVTAFAIEAVSQLLFPKGPPLGPRIILLLSEFTMVIAFLIPAIRLTKNAYALVVRSGDGRTRSPAQATSLRTLAGSVLKIYSSSVGAGAITGAILSALVLLLIPLASAPWWIKLTLYCLGLLATIAGIGGVILARKEEKEYAKGLGASFSVGLCVMFIFLPVGVFLMALTFAADAAQWSGALETIARIVLGRELE